MPTEIGLSDEDIKYLNEPAREQLRKHIDGYIDQLLIEASRLEAAHRTTDGNPEINSSMINDAAHLIRLGYHKHKKPRWLTALQIVSVTAALFTGIFFDLERLKDPVVFIAFITSFSIAIISNAVVLLKD